MAKVKDKTKRIMKANIRFISLCQRGANTFSTIYKADDGEDKNLDFTTLCKDMDEKGVIVACMYAPEKVDSQGDIASAAVIEKFAHDFLKNGEGIDTMHDEDVLSKNDISVAESFIIQKGDERFADMKDYDGNIVDVTGGWGVVLKVDSEDLRSKYRSGEWGGLSMGGTANKKEDTDSKVMKALKDLLNINKKEIKVTKNTENIMPFTPEQITEIGKVAGEVVVKVMADTKKADDLKKAEDIKKAAADGPKLGLGKLEPVLKTNPTTKELDRYSRELEIFKMSEKVDKTDRRAVFEFNKAAGEIAKCKDLEEAINKQDVGGYESYFTSNQNISEIEKADLSNEDNDNGVSAAIEKSMDEAEKKSA